MLVSELIRHLKEEISFDCRFENDPTGLLAGSPNSEITGILLVLDVTEEVISEAVDRNCNLIISHHPLFYHPLKNMVSGNFYTDIVRALIINNLALISLHTCFDLQFSNGVSKALATALSLKNIAPLIPAKSIKGCQTGAVMKLAVYTPPDYCEKIKLAIHNSGGGVIGDYDNCFFTSTGTGTFRGNSQTNPFIGKPQELTTVDEVKLETIVFSDRVDSVLKAVKAAHPYEEPAVDIYQIDNLSQNQALGCIGDLPVPMSASELKSFLQERLDSSSIRYAFSTNKKYYTKIAVAGGSCSGYWKSAYQAGADLFLTSEIDHHTCLEAKRQISLADATHYTTEKFSLLNLHSIISRIAPGISSLISEKQHDPFE